MNKQIKIEIKNRWTGDILFEYLSENNTIKKTVAEAIKSEAALCEADLRGADLRGANLCEADLRRANLCGADLCEAALCEADLREADLRGANLYGANLREADLRRANLCGANLCEAKGVYMACPTDGSFIGWKKAEGLIVKLQIPKDARRSSSGGIKCRCNKAYVIAIQNIDGKPSGVMVAHSNHDHNFVYEVGKTVEVNDFCDDRWNECAPGIHFFIDRRAAVEY